jgi:hypothetical protein
VLCSRGWNDADCTGRDLQCFELWDVFVGEVGEQVILYITKPLHEGCIPLNPAPAAFRVGFFRSTWRAPLTSPNFIRYDPGTIALGHFISRPRPSSTGCAADAFRSRLPQGLLPPRPDSARFLYESTTTCLEYPCDIHTGIPWYGLFPLRGLAMSPCKRRLPHALHPLHSLTLSSHSSVGPVRRRIDNHYPAQRHASSLAVSP